MSSMTPASPLPNPSTIAIVIAVLVGTAVLGTVLVRSGTLSIAAVVGGFVLAWVIMYAHRLEPLGDIARSLNARGDVVTLSSALALTVGTYVLVSTLPLEAWLVTNASFGLLLGVFAVILGGP